jgi:hypothetical protein
MLRAASVLAFAFAAHSAYAADLKALYDAHQWFELRDALRTDPGIPLYRIAAAAAFNHVRQADDEFAALVKSATEADGPMIGEAASWIISLHGRSGRYRRIIPGAKVPDLGNFPTLELVGRAPSVVRGEVGVTGHLLAPILINGHAARFAIDSGAAISLVTESEAKRVGLTMVPGRPSTTWFAGAVSKQRMAFAKTLEIGKYGFRNVAFLVTPDATLGDAAHEVPGAVGLPLLIAMETFQWNRDGDLQFGYPIDGSGAAGEPNLCFDGWLLAARIKLQQRKIYAVLDTGNPASQWWPPLAHDFPTLLEQSSGKRTVDIFGGDAAQAEASIVPHLSLQIGGLPVTQDDAPILSVPTGHTSDYYAGNLGLDPLMQARRVSIDFKSLVLTLR